MPSNSAKRRADVLLLFALCACFVALGWPFLKRMGIEADEALVGSGLFGRVAAWYSWRLFGHEIPVMLLGYLGALKTWVYAPIFAIWDASAISVRLPTALLGAGTIALFWRLLKDVCGTSAAWVGAILLAIDTSFLLLTTIDFGPVALQALPENSGARLVCPLVPQWPMPLSFLSLGIPRKRGGADPLVCTGPLDPPANCSTSTSRTPRAGQGAGRGRGRPPHDLCRRYSRLPGSYSGGIPERGGRHHSRPFWETNI